MDQEASARCLSRPPKRYEIYSNKRRREPGGSSNSGAAAGSRMPRNASTLQPIEESNSGKSGESYIIHFYVFIFAAFTTVKVAADVFLNNIFRESCSPMSRRGCFYSKRQVQDISVLVNRFVMQYKQVYLLYILNLHSSLRRNQSRCSSSNCSTFEYPTDEKTASHLNTLLCKERLQTHFYDTASAD